MCVLWRKRALREVEGAVQAVDAVVDVELVAEKGNVLLGMTTQLKERCHLWCHEN